MRDPEERLRARLVAAPLWAHWLVVGLALLALVPLVGTEASYSADEGGAIIQARSLADGDGWIVEHPFPEVDPDGRMYPLELSSAGPDGIAAFAKHPLYPLLLAGADRAGGHQAMVLVSVSGLWLAAIGASCLSGAILGGYRRTALWLAAFGTPLLFNGYWVIAHSLGAAAVVWATLAAWQLVAGERRRWLAMLAAPALMAVATLLRTEALLFGGAMALVVGLLGLRQRRWSPMVLGAAVATASYGAYRVDAWWERSAVGGAASSTGSFEARDRSGLVSGQVDGLVATWLRSAPAGSDAIPAALVFASSVLIIASVVLLARRRPGIAGVGAVGAVVLLAVRHVAEPAAPVPGLLMAFPLVVGVGACLLSRRGQASDGLLVVAGIVLVSWAGVAATQYPEGGVAEWGGRYFALGLPLAVPLVIGGLAARLEAVERSDVRRLVLAWGAATLLMSTLSLRELASVHNATAELLDDIDEVVQGADPARVVVTDAPPIPRLDWERFDERAWLLARPSEAQPLAARLAEAGQRQWVIVSADPQAFLGALGEVTVVGESRDGVLLVRYVGG